jgi:heat shock protein HtpX
MGAPEDAGIVVSEGLLRRLTPYEITGVLAHETSHVVNRDTALMLFASLAGRLTGLLSGLAVLGLWIALPLVLAGVVTFNPLAILVLIAAPHASALVTLALSRAREFEADLDAARLVGDPAPLASALVKLERSERSLIGRLLWPTPSVPPLLRSHPPTEERVRRLMALRVPAGTGPLSPRAA